HAWAEVWLAGRGWVRVDPTAAVAPERIYDTLADRVPGAFDAFPGLAPVFDTADWLRRGWNDLVLGFDATRQQRLLQPFGSEDLGASGLLALFIATAVIALAWMLWLTARAERERDPVLRAWHRLGARYAGLGLGREPHEPAAAWAQRVVAVRPQAGALAMLSARFSDWRYAGSHRDPRTLRGLIQDLRAHRP
ncbi:MAG: transglutaminase family protein, partial [Gammaproteobacteria bacterium]|nr:transglutaminase family protein [Gammaproteobacteria bacterium]